MNDILFYLLILALLYYFFIYLPQQKPIEPIKPLTQSQFTQTEPIPLQAEPTLEPLLDDLITQIRKLNHTLN